MGIKNFIKAKKMFAEIIKSLSVGASAPCRHYSSFGVLFFRSFIWIDSGAILFALFRNSTIEIGFSYVRGDKYEHFFPMLCFNLFDMCTQRVCRKS
jgi:hypothetical protein